jgi:hypothetical protein
MDKFDRIFQMHTILSGRRTPISGEELQARLECHRATLHRIISAPGKRGEAYEPPGLCFLAVAVAAAREQSKKAVGWRLPRARSVSFHGKCRRQQDGQCSMGCIRELRISDAR